MTKKVVLPIGKNDNDKEVYHIMFGSIPARILFRFCEMIAVKLDADPEKTTSAIVGLSDELAAAIKELEG